MFMSKGAAAGRRKVLLIAIVFISLGVITPAWADFIRSVSFPKDSTVTGSDNRYYSLYIPSGYNASIKMPLVVTLHGCRQSDLEMVNKGKMHLEAERENFIVFYPFMNNSTDPTVGGSNDDDGRNPNCWGYWLDAERVRGGGEVHDIKRMVDKIKSQYNIDADRVHIVGISSGGGMANIAQVAYPDVFASAVIVEGIAYKETAGTYTGNQQCSLILNKTRDAANRDANAIIADMRKEMQKSVLRQAPVMVIHNEQDCTVPISVGKNLAKTWAGLLGAEGKALDLSKPTSVANSPAGEFKWTHSKYGALPNGQSLLETFYLNVSEQDVLNAGVQVLTRDTYAPGSDDAVKEDTRKGHWWSGGERGPWVINAGPNTSALAWSFFKNHPKCTETSCPGTGPQPPVVNPFAAESGATCANLTGRATDPDNDLDRVEVRVDGGAWQTATLLADGSFQAQVCPAAGSHTAEARAMDKLNAFSPVVSAAFTIGTPTVKAGNKTWNQITDAAKLGKLQNAYYYYWPEAVPAGKMRNGKRALMLTLHGCSQTAPGHVINKGFNWEATAEEYGMVVVAPTKPDSGKHPRSGTGQFSGRECFDWFDTNHDRTGRDAGSLIGLVNALKNDPNLAIDPDQVYVSGLSGGSGEALVLGCVAPDIFGGIAVVETPTLGSPGTFGSSPRTPQQVKDLCQQLAGSHAPELKSQVVSVACGDQSGFKPFCDNTVEGYKLLWGGTACSATTDVARGGKDTRCSNATTKQVVSSLLIPNMKHA